MGNLYWEVYRVAGNTKLVERDTKLAVRRTEREKKTADRWERYFKGNDVRLEKDYQRWERVWKRKQSIGDPGGKQGGKKKGGKRKGGKKGGKKKGGKKKGGKKKIKKKKGKKK